MTMWVPMGKGDGSWPLDYIRTVLWHFIPHLAKHPISPSVDKISECLTDELLDSFWLHVYIHTYIYTLISPICVYTVCDICIYPAHTYTNKCAHIYIHSYICVHTLICIYLSTYIYLDPLKCSTWNIFRPMNSGKCKASIWQIPSWSSTRLWLAWALK